MATGTDVDSAFQAGRRLWWRRIKGRVFKGVLVGSTLLGVFALVVLFLLIGLDAFGPLSASPEWYLVYFATVVGPVSAYTLYVRRRPSVADLSAISYFVTFGALALSLVAYAVPAALNSHDVVIYAVPTVVPPVAIVAYGRVYGESRLTGPAVPVSTVLGLAGAIVLYDAVIPIVSILADWPIYVALVTVPVAGILGLLAARRWSARQAVAVAIAVFAGAGVTAVIALSRGTDPSLWIVLVSGFVAPVGFLAVDTVKRRPEDAIGLFGPFVLVGGALLGAWIESQYGLAGLEAWLNPTLLLESWSDFRPEGAGIYPQLIGSIVIVGIMAVMAFPVGIGAAIYLEEYAPSTGWHGRLANALDVNISNLAGVPSVVYGLLGLALFRQVFGLAPGIIVAAAATLGLLILPIVIVSSQEALRAVPDELRGASFGLGASHWQTVRNVVLPRAVPGILTGTILSLGRAIGETAPLVMIGVATTRFSPPEGLLSGATALPLQIFAAKGNNIPEYRTGVVAAAAIVLLLLMLLMNATAILIRNRYQKN